MFRATSTGFYNCSQKQLPAGRLFDLLRFSLPGMLAVPQDTILLTSHKTFRNFHRKQTGGQALELLCSKNDRGEFGGFASGIQDDSVSRGLQG